ncbi:MAG: ABC transporter ATP-binding protein/permease [Paludibacteraceae bacterium]|nr:ABC transporter ATP-binding protein [Candidatus Physcocola equi]MCQ2233654.1 ABC transporter ATP-binding protein/permease [Paludibacteraceae bacterium]
MNEWKMLFQYMKRHWFLAFMAPVLVMIEVFAEVAQPAIMANIVNDGVLGGNSDVIYSQGLKMIVFTIVGAVGGVLSIYAAANVAYRVSADVRRDMFSHIHKLSFSFVDKLQIGSLITRMTDDVTRVQRVIQASLRLLFRAPIMFVSAIALLLMLDVNIAVVLVVMVPLLLVFIFLLLRNTIPFFAVVQQKLDGLNGFLREMLAGIKVVKTYAGEKSEQRRFQGVNQDWTSTSISVALRTSLLMPISALIIDFGVISVLYVGGYEATDGRMNVGDIMAATNYLSQIMMSLRMASHIIMDLAQADASLVRIAELMKTPSEDDRADSTVSPADGAVVFEHVSFGYDASKPFIKDISFDIPSGQTLLLLGSTGSGKSTLISLLLRFYDADSGTILLGGKDIKSMSRKTLHTHVGVVSQRAQFFVGTIASNLRIGKNDATDNEMMRALEMAQLADFVRKVPEGLNYPVEQDGVNLSGGQRQRLSLARTLLSNPDVLILDNCIAAMDFLTASKIWKAVESLNSTRIVIAQRPSVACKADKIVLLKDGCVERFGDFAELKDICEAALEGKEVE